jgi:prefoldin subunit 5
MEQNNYRELEKRINNLQEEVQQLYDQLEEIKIILSETLRDKKKDN